MSKYDMREYNIPGQSVNSRDIIPEAEMRLHEEKNKHLRSLGVYTAIYTDNFITFPTHPDGIHTYLQDASLARDLVMNDKELPQDLLDRLAYYKPIMDELLQTDSKNAPTKRESNRSLY